MSDQRTPGYDPATDTATTVTPMEPHEATGEVVATAPVAGGAGTAARPRSRARWVAALAIVALVVTASAAAAFLLTSAAPTATVMGYVPSDSVAYGEIRLDLPGDQEQAVGEFLSHFPGFADQAALDSKLDEVLDRLVSDATEGDQTFTADIKPWFDGELAFAMGPLPESASSSDPASAAAKTRGLVLLAVKDATMAAAWFDGVVADMGGAPTTETYGGVEMTVFGETATPGATTAFAIVGGEVALIGDVTSVKAAIDTNGDAGLAGDPAFDAAANAMDGGYLGFMYVDARAVVDSALALGADMGATRQLSDAMLALVPEWMAYRLRVEGDALVMDGAQPRVDAAPGPDANATNEVAAWAPPSTVFLAAGQDVGPTVLEAIEQYRADPGAREFIDGLEEGAGILGGLDAALGWMGDAGVVISADGDVLEGGIVAIPTDADAAEQLLTTIRSFATLGGAQGITVREEDYAGATIVIIDLGSTKDLAGMAGALGGGTLPTDPSTAPLPEGDVELAYAATDGVVVIGSGPDFVKSVLDAGAGTSLADDARFQDLLGRVGEQNTGVSFADVTALRGVLEGFLDEASAEERAEYEESIKPFLEPFDAFIAATALGDDLNEQHAVITVK